MLTRVAWNTTTSKADRNANLKTSKVCGLFLKWKKEVRLWLKKYLYLKLIYVVYVGLGSKALGFLLIYLFTFLNTSILPYVYSTDIFAYQ
jgi:hypothetical protein